jgi:hypothetical protein
MFVFLSCNIVPTSFLIALSSILRIKINFYKVNIIVKYSQNPTTRRKSIKTKIKTKFTFDDYNKQIFIQ